MPRSCRATAYAPAVPQRRRTEPRRSREVPQDHADNGARHRLTRHWSDSLVLRCAPARSTVLFWQTVALCGLARQAIDAHPPVTREARFAWSGHSRREGAWYQVTAWQPAGLTQITPRRR